MQRLLVVLTIFGLFLTACGTPAGPVIVPTEVIPTPVEPTPTAEPEPVDVPAANAAVQALAALLGLDPSQINLISIEAVEWTDSCLGIVYIDAICAQGIVPGYRIVLEANGQQYEYHTNADGSSLALAPMTADTAAEAAVQAARAALARALRLREYQVELVSLQGVEWPDACLGVVRVGVMCAQGVTSGYRLLLEANGQLFEYHTNLDGSALVVAPVSDAVAANPAALAALAALAKALGLTTEQIRVVSVAPREWPDACLGMSAGGKGCAQVITPGFNIVLEANEGHFYEYHTNQDGTSVQPASVALSWSRHGGIAGFCDELIVYRSGEIVVHNCGNEAMAQGTLSALSAEEVAKLNQWLAQYGPVTIAHDDGAVADSMAVSLNLAGSGTEQPSETEQQALLDWAQNLYTQIPVAR